MENMLYLIPLIPLLSAAFLGAFGKKLPRAAVHLLSPFAVFVSFMISVACFVKLRGMGETGFLTQHLFNWIELPEITIGMSFYFDHLTAVMALVVTGVGFLIHVYSVGYMHHDTDYVRFFAYLNLFTGFMLILITAKNLPLMFIGWEGVGLCSYLLIGFWFKDMANAKAGKKAFIVNRVGDFGFIIGMMILALEVQRATGIMSLDFIEMKGAIAFLGNPANTLTFMGLSMVGVACAALFIGATGKSAQIPLYVWLPDAMAGPTPVSALIHAATMVTAGVYMIGRLNDFFLLVPNLLGIVAWVGALTALYAATIAITQFDIKKVLAYSTVSQLGYMFVAMGVGAFSTGIFHLVTHAFFKGLLFLAAGAVIHSLHEEQDIRKMGGLKKLTPITFWLFAAGWYAICALPFGSGYFSKDAILVHAANSANGGMALFAIALLTGGMTAFYMSRLFFLTFFGECRYKKPEDIHDSPISMTGPMGILALLSLVGGFINIPSWLSHSFAGTIPEAGHLSHGMVAGISTLFVFCGITLAWYLYLKKPALSASMAKKGHALHDFSGQAYYINELYGALFVKPALKLGEVLTRLVDKSMLDGVCIHGTASLVMKLGGLVTLLQSGRLTSYLLSLTLGTLFLLYFLIY